jgi:hypothetical protein
VATPELLELLTEEVGSFQNIDNIWRPKNLFFDIQTQELLRDMVSRYQQLRSAEEELKTLDRADLFVKNLRKMDFIVKRAHFVRRSNHLAFGLAVAEFYSLFGEVLRFLRIDQARGKLQPV